MVITIIGMDEMMAGCWRHLHAIFLGAASSSLLLSDSDSDKKIGLNLKHTLRANFLHDDVY